MIVAPSSLRARRFAAICGAGGFLLIGWSSLVVPALATQVEQSYGQTDAGLALYYLLNSITYAVGSVGGGIATERIGRRRVLVASAILHGLGLLLQAGTGSWEIFLFAGLLRGLGTGGIDGGVNGLILDLFPEARGRALNAAHLFFSLGALAAPLAIGGLTEAGVGWQPLVAVTGIASLPLAIGFVLADLRDGRRVHAHHAAESLGAVPRATLLSLPVITLAAAIGFYVASEMGVSSWLVRFFASTPIFVADAALGLFWGGLTLGRLVSAAWSDRFDHPTLAVVAAFASAAALCAAVLVPVVPLSIALFAVVGFAFGPVYPLIMAIAGERFPTRAAAVSGVLSGAAVIGSILYPPLMGVLSVTVGISAAMLGTGLIAFACGGALLASRYAVRLHALPDEGAPLQEPAAGR